MIKRMLEACIYWIACVITFRIIRVVFKDAQQKAYSVASGCGQEIVVKTNCLRSGRIFSCGCAELRCPAYVEILRTKTAQNNNTNIVTGVKWLVRTKRWYANHLFQREPLLSGQLHPF